tara:strand:+ start:274 stop:675 length:402 start_codon:yes stop_codon:yes gene_type:complete
MIAVQDFTSQTTKHFVVHVLRGSTLLLIKQPKEFTYCPIKLLVLFVKKVGTATNRTSSVAKHANQEHTMIKLTKTCAKHVLWDRTPLLTKQIAWFVKKESTMIKRINCFAKIVGPQLSTIKRGKMTNLFASLA